MTATRTITDILRDIRADPEITRPYVDEEGYEEAHDYLRGIFNRRLSDFHGQINEIERIHLPYMQDASLGDDADTILDPNGVPLPDMYQELNRYLLSALRRESAKDHPATVDTTGQYLAEIDRIRLKDASGGRLSVGEAEMLMWNPQLDPACAVGSARSLVIAGLDGDLGVVID